MCCLTASGTSCHSPLQAPAQLRGARRGGTHDAGNELQQLRLAAAVRAQQHPALPGTDLPVNVGQHASARALQRGAGNAHLQIVHRGGHVQDLRSERLRPAGRRRERPHPDFRAPLVPAPGAASRLMRRSQHGLEHPPVLHDEADVLEHADIRQRVAPDGDQVRVGARGDDADRRALSSSSAARPVADWIACIGVMPNSTSRANSCAIGSLHTKPPTSVPKAILTPARSALRNDTPCTRHALAVALAARRVRRVQVVVVDRQRRHVPGALPHHLRDLRIGELQAVLDRVAAAIERALQADAVVGVAGDLAAPAVGLVDDGAQLLDASGSAATPGRPSHRPRSDASCRP